MAMGGQFLALLIRNLGSMGSKFDGFGYRPLSRFFASVTGHRGKSEYMGM
jgi:hypothetical protein